MKFFNCSTLTEGEFDKIVANLPNHERLSMVLRWFGEMAPPVAPVLNVAQDEFSHDVVLPFKDELFLAFDVT